MQYTQLNELGVLQKTLSRLKLVAKTFCELQITISVLQTHARTAHGSRPGCLLQAHGWTSCLSYTTPCGTVPWVVWERTAGGQELTHLAPKAASGRQRSNRLNFRYTWSHHGLHHTTSTTPAEVRGGLSLCDLLDPCFETSGARRRVKCASHPGRAEPCQTHEVVGVR